jgi:hypothetical protein
MLRWLGFFLLVFAVAGLGYYFAGDPGNGVFPIGGPLATPTIADRRLAKADDTP